jgi:hypothetical protein
MVPLPPLVPVQPFTGKLLKIAVVLLVIAVVA